jgi:hypothetical protein
MIPNHAQFVAAIKERKKVFVRFYSKADSGVLDRVCAPMDYGPGGENQDGLNRYWLWDYACNTGSHNLGLEPRQILEVQVLGEVFDPGQFTPAPATSPVSPTSALTPAIDGASGSAKVSK